MDPLAHTLVGAALGRAVAGRDVPAAGWIGAIAANAPDWSELVLKPDLWPPRAGGEYLVFHRGITHSFVGAAGAGGVRGGRRGGLDPALVRSGGPAPGRGVWAGGARRVRRRERRGEPRGQGADSRRRVTAVRPRRPLGAAHHRGATLPLGGALRFAGQRRGTRVGRRSAPRPPRGARGPHHLARPGHRAIRAVPCGGAGFEQRRRPRIAMGCALPRTPVRRRRPGGRAGPAPLMRLDWAAR